MKTRFIGIQIIRLLEDLEHLSRSCSGAHLTEVVHRLRVSIKKTRAMLRLFDHELPNLKHHHKVLREVSRGLQGYRQIGAAQETFTWLRIKKNSLALKAGRDPEGPAEIKILALEGIKKNRLVLFDLQKKMKAYELRGLKLKKALSQSRKVFIKSLKCYKKKQSLERLHTLRKKSKNVLYQLEALGLAEISHGGPNRRSLKKISDCSGHILDIETFIGRLRKKDIRSAKKREKKLKSQILLCGAEHCSQ